MAEVVQGGQGAVGKWADLEHVHPRHLARAQAAGEGALWFVLGTEAAARAGLPFNVSPDMPTAVIKDAMLAVYRLASETMEGDE